MKKLVSILVSGFLFFSLIGCSPEDKNVETKGNNNSQSGSESENSDLIDSLEGFKQMYSKPDEYKHVSVEFPAIVFTEPRADGNEVTFQVYAFNNENLNTMIVVEDVSDIKSDDIVMIKGTLDGFFEGENGFGAKLEMPVIEASSLDKTDYASQFSPAIKTIEINEKIDQHGYLMEVDRIEFSEDETRVYLTIENNTEDNISLYNFNAKAVQGSTQLKEEDNWGKGYDEIESEILPDVKDSGVVVFGKGNPEQPIKIYFEGSSDDYELIFEPFIFETK